MAVVYFTQEIREDSRLREKSIAAIKQTASKGNLEVIEADSFDSLTKQSRKSVLSSFTELYNQIATMGLNEWIDANIEKIDAAFLTAFSLVAQGRLKVNIYFAANKRLTEKDILEDLQGQLRRLVQQRILNIAIKLLEQTRFPLIDEELSRIIPACAVTEELVQEMARVVEKAVKDPAVTARQQYPLEVVLAWTAWRGEVTNPRARNWAAYFAGLTCAAALNPSADSIKQLLVTDEFAKKTISFQDLWDEFAIRGNEVKPEEMKVLAETLSRLGFASEAHDVAFDLMGFNIPSSVSSEELGNLKEMFTSQLSEDSDVSKAAFSILLKNDRWAEANEVLEASVAAHQRAGRFTEATYIVCRFVECANSQTAHDVALQEVLTWEATLEKNQGWNRISLHQQLDFLNEVGNCFRYKGQFLEALRKYREALQLCPPVESTEEANETGEPADKFASNRRVLWRNIAIIYRYQGRLADGNRLLHLVANNAESPLERAQALHSIGVNYLMAGDRESAIRSFQSVLRSIESKRPQAYAKQRFTTLLTLGSSLLGMQNKSAAFAVLSRALHVANDILHDVGWATVTAGIIASQNMGDEMPNYREFVEKTYSMLWGMLKEPDKISLDQRTGILLGLAGCALDLDDYNGLSVLQSHIEALPEGVLYGQRWKIYSYLAVSANKQNKFDDAKLNLQRAWSELIKTRSQHDLGFDQSGLMLDAEALQANTAEFFLSAFQRGQVEADYLVLASEFQTGVLQNMAYLDSGPSKLLFEQRSASADWVSEDLQYLQATGGEQALAVVQILRVSGFDRILVSIHDKGVKQCHLLKTHLTRERVRATADEFRFKVGIFNPAEDTNLFSELSLWSDLTGEFASEIRELVRPGSHLCIIPSYTFSRLPIHLAVSGNDDRPLLMDYTFSYSPSLFITARLRERGLRRSSANQGRLRKLSDFTVWQIGDRKSVIDLFQHESDKFLALGERHGCEVRSVRGTEATAKAFSDLLSWSDCFRISCHGIADPIDGKHRFLVSDGMNLPPTDLRALESETSEPLFLDWDEIDSPASPPVVLSCACSSGAVSIGRGAERIGFERVLFRLGTNAFIAPLWDVPVADIQPMLNRTLDIYLEKQEFSIAQALSQAQHEALDSGRPLHIVGSAVVHGDWI